MPSTCVNETFALSQVLHILYRVNELRNVVAWGTRCALFAAALMTQGSPLPESSRISFAIDASYRFPAGRLICQHSPEGKTE